MAVTLKDISKRTGINMGSVSHVLNKHPKADALRKETRERILKTAKELGYRRNELAATIRTGVSSTVAIIVDFSNEGHGSFINSAISGILITATELGYGVKLYSSENLTVSFQEIESHCIKHVIAETVDPELRCQLAEYCSEKKVKLTYIFECACGNFPAVTSDDRIGFRDAVSYLAGYGHSRIALICAKHSFNYMDERHNGYLDGLRGNGLAIDERLIDCSRYLKDSGKAIEKMLSLPRDERPTAFCCIADSMAMLVQRVALKKNLSVPEDVSVIGFSDSDNIDCAYAPLSSISQPYEEIGKTALLLVLGRECGSSPTKDNRYLLLTSLVERSSVARRCGT